MPSYSELVVRYRYVRELGKSMGRDMMDRASKGGHLKEGGRELGLLRKGVFVFDNETEGALLFDYAIYNVQRDGHNVVQAMLAEHVYPDGSEEANHLHDMNNAWYSLFVIERMELGVGAHVRDLIRKTTHLLIDLGVGQSGGPGNLLASRVVPMDGFIMSTGAILPLGADLESCQRPIADIVKRYCSKNNDAPCHLSAEEERSLARSIISTGLNAGLSRRMRSRDAGQPINDDDLLLDDDDGFGRSPVPVRTGGRVGRNDSCPCGSGRKYKHCCGKG